MRAVRCHGQSVRVEDVPAPVGEGVRIRIASAGICGSDLHLLSSSFPLEATLGHEMAGWLPDGRPVAIEPLQPCGHCQRCVEGAYNLCDRGPAMVMGTALDGGMADELIVPERSIVLLPGAIPATDACLIEPLAVAIHGLRLATASGGERVAVVGAGSIGLCAVAACVASEVETAVVARHDTQREAASRLGATEADGSYDLVIDAAGTTSSLQQAVSLCRPGGRLLLLATYWDGLELPGFELWMKEVRVIPAAMYSRAGAVRDMDTAAAILARRPQLAEILITHRFPLDAAVEAFAVAADRSSGAIKVVLEP